MISWGEIALWLLQTAIAAGLFFRAPADGAAAQPPPGSVLLVLSRRTIMGYLAGLRPRCRTVQGSCRCWTTLAAR
jgi:hypothetical protein